jgi:WXG100 family type VII secretion target
MSDFTSYDSGLLQQGISDLQQAHTKVETDLTDLEHEVEGSLAQWEGSARDAYKQAKAQWDASAQRMTQVIQTMQSVMTNIADRYDSNERGVTGLFA